VTATGVVAVVVLLAFTSHTLRVRNAQPNDRPTGVRPPPPGARPDPTDDLLRRGGEAADSTIADARTLGIVMVGGFAIASLALGWYVAGRMVRPLHDITRVAGEVAGGRFGERIELAGPRDELTAMADTFDAMLDRLDAAFGAQRAFVADASHELRTPLTLMRAEIDVALDDPDADASTLRDALAAASDALARTTRLVESLLALSRSEVLVHVEDHDLGRSAERSLLHHAPTRTDVRTDLAAAPVRGDAVLIDRVVDNLVENALRYTPAGGLISVTAGSTGPDSYLRVANDGPVLSETDVEEMFERFHRRDGRRNPHGGAGLGLAIVRSAVHTHGGSVVGRPRDGGGLDVTVVLPAAPVS